MSGLQCVLYLVKLLLYITFGGNLRNDDTGIDIHQHSMVRTVITAEHSPSHQTDQRGDKTSSRLPSVRLLSDWTARSPPASSLLHRQKNT